MYRIVFLISFLAFGCQNAPHIQTNTSDVPNPLADIQALIYSPAPHLTFEVDPRIEVLSGGQLWTSWTKAPQGGAPDGMITEYTDALKTFFEPFQDHQAMKLLEKTSLEGFSWDAPPGMVLSTLGTLNFKEPQGGFSAYHLGRIGGRKKALALTQALSDLGVKSNFKSFWDDHLGEYEDLLQKVSTGVDGKAIIDWLNSYYGAKSLTEFHIVLATAMFPGGGYSSTQEREENGTKVDHIFIVIRNADRTTPSLVRFLALHEFGHSFVNPVIGDRIPPSALPGLKALFKAVEPQMESQAYGHLSTYLSELVLRAITIRGGENFGDIESQEAAIKEEEKLGFWGTREVLVLLKDYEADRKTYGSFEDYAPILLTKLAAQSDRILNRK